MPVSTEYIDWLTERLVPLGSVSTRRMFSGVGLFADGLMFALVVDDVLYLKSDPDSGPAYDAAGCVPFQYQRSGKTATLTSYRRCPDDAFDDDDVLIDWVRRGIGASARANDRKPKHRRRGKK